MIELTLSDIQLLKFLARYAVADIECIRTIYQPYGGKRYYEERISRLKSREIKYISLRNQQTTYTLLKKGMERLKNLGIDKAAWYSGSRKCLGRLEEVSKTAVILMKADIYVLGDRKDLQDTEKIFIPSNIIKKEIYGIDRQSRFTGILFSNCGNHAVYNLGDGSRIWQPLSESSLFKGDLRDGWCLNGMILLADDSHITDIAAKVTITDLNPCRHTTAVKGRKNPLRLWPGYKSCCLLGKNEAVFMIKLLTTADWRQKVIKDISGDVALLGGSPIEPDFYYNSASVYMMLDNDLLRAHLLRNYMSTFCGEFICSNPIQIYCLENHQAIYIGLFPDARIIPVRMSRLERILENGGGNPCR
ncbi:MAG: hypothetical protein FIA99_07215 [Ruminiclostridium sp.]|nr:hypothetical protein [Ruminiclostridium sp.]